MARLPTLGELGIRIVVDRAMRDLDDTLTAIGFRLKSDGLWREAEDVVRKHRPAGARITRRTKLAVLADLRLLMLRAGYPVGQVQAFDR